MGFIKGKFNFIFILLISSYFSYSYSTTNTDPIDIINQHISQLGKLDDLVKNLTQLVTRLESHLAEKNPKNNNNNFVLDNDDDDDIKRVGEANKGEETRFSNENDDVGMVKGDKLRAVSVTKHSLFWSERFQFVSAVKIDTLATSLNVLPFKDVEGLSKYVGVGDVLGNVYVFSRYGDVMVQFDTMTGAPVTAILSYLSVFRNESVVVTGHANGVVLLHKVWEVANGDESTLLEKKTVLKVGEESGSEISILEVHHVGRTRYIVSIDVGGKIKVFKENGAMIGAVVSSSPPLAFLKQKLLLLTETGAESLDLRTMKLKYAPCEGLNGSHALNYVFDASDRGKAYGFTAAGELVHLLIYGDSMSFKCRVRSKKKFDVDHGPLAFEAIKGYFLIASQEKVFLYNVSSQLYTRAGIPRLVFSAGLDEIIASFLDYQAMRRLNANKNKAIPLIASDHEKLVILSLGSGYIGMYRSNLPISKGEFNTMLWSTPVLFFILFLFVAWHFFANKKEALTSWGPDDPFPNGAPSGGTGERSFGDPTSRNHDIMDLRGSSAPGASGGNNGSGIRGPTRRYGSPTRFTGPGANSFRPTSMETVSRPASVDPDYRGSDLKYRGSNIESSGFGKRREGLFVNSQVVDDRGS
ncbi:WD40-repeat-containing domain-containing protein [Artemisia annua]|uniref:WD40-repeat-containing domain-containing protein n=1 Tax=Artemisia annua TaxID=35608 RepID=A0A2U1N7Q9_ARTAN|nr:WD40-repeat-containing domain-containing protein [Artemisia annua]